MIQTDEKINCILGLKESKLLKITILPKTVYRVSAVSIKLLVTFFTRLEQNNFKKFVWKQKRPQIAKTILRKKNTAGGITVPDFRLYYRDTVMKKYVTVTETRQID